MKSLMFVLLLALLFAPCCSSAADEKMGQAVVVQKGAIETAKVNREKGLRTYDAELRKVSDREFALLFEREVSKMPTLTKEDVMRLYTQAQAQRVENGKILDQKLAQWLSDPSLDEALAVADMAEAYARTNSQAATALADLLKAKKAAAAPTGGG